MKLTRLEAAQLYELIAQGVRPCRQCGRVLPLSAFHKAKREIGGVVSRCKECARTNYQANKQEIKRRQAEYRKTHHEDILAKKKAYYYSHREKCLGQTAQYRSDRRAELAAKQRAYYQRTLADRRAYEASRRESREAYHKAWYEAHAEEVAERQRRYRMEHAEEIAEWRKRYYLEHLEEAAQWHKRYQAEHAEELREARRRYLQTAEGKAANRRGVHKREARVRALDFSFSYEDWKATLAFFDYQCAYCGESVSDLQQDHVVPVSRGGGYVVGNIVPCCARCNGSKHTTNLADWALSRGAAFLVPGALERIEEYRSVGR